MALAGKKKQVTVPSLTTMMLINQQCPFQSHEELKQIQQNTRFSKMLIVCILYKEARSHKMNVTAKHLQYQKSKIEIAFRHEKKWL